MRSNNKNKIEIVDLNYLHDALLPEELDIERGYNSIVLEQQTNNDFLKTAIS